MKISISILLIIILFAYTEMQAQDPDISGTWTMCEMTWNRAGEVHSTTEDQMKEEGMFTDYFLMPDKKFRIVTNMSGSGNLETVEGTWELEGGSLICSIRVDASLMDIVWDLEFKGEKIHLTRSTPDGSATVVNSFRRK